MIRTMIAWAVAAVGWGSATIVAILLPTDASGFVCFALVVIVACVLMLGVEIGRDK